MQKTRHDEFLEKLVYRLNEVHEEKKNIRWILKEGIWLYSDSLSHQKMCDLILVYHSYAIPIELKGSFEKRKNALKQIYQGKRFITEELHLRVPYGKFVVYTGGRYKFEKISSWQLDELAKERNFQKRNLEIIASQV